MLRSAVKDAVFRTLGSRLGAQYRIRRIKAGRQLTILNLHRVAPHDDSTYPPLDPALFDYLLGFVSAHFEMVTFSELGQLVEGSKPRMILSFDDAYKDFLEYAVPLLDKHKIKANQNIVPHCVETGLPPLNVMLQDYVGRAPAELLDKLEVPSFKAGPMRESRSSFGNRLSGFLKNKPMAEQDALRDALIPQMAECQEFAPAPMMSLSEVGQIAGTHEIGAHSYYHASLAHENDGYLSDDIARCRRWMAEKLRLPLHIYALPNGSYRPSHMRILREEGVKHILLVDEDFSAEDADIHHRFTFDARSRQEVRFRATGGYRLRNSRVSRR